jgi:hypothetical protein
MKKRLSAYLQRQLSWRKLHPHHHKQPNALTLRCNTPWHQTTNGTPNNIETALWIAKIQARLQQQQLSWHRLEWRLQQCAESAADVNTSTNDSKHTPHPKLKPKHT